MPDVLDSPWDHNAECRYCDEQAMHRGDCPWLLRLIAEVTRLRSQRQPEPTLGTLIAQPVGTTGIVITARTPEINAQKEADVSDIPDNPVRARGDMQACQDLAEHFLPFDDERPDTPITEHEGRVRSLGIAIRDAVTLWFDADATLRHGELAGYDPQGITWVDQVNDLEQALYTAVRVKLKRTHLPPDAILTAQIRELLRFMECCPEEGRFPAYTRLMLAAQHVLTALVAAASTDAGVDLMVQLAKKKLM